MGTLKSFLLKKSKGVSNYLSAVVCMVVLSAFFVGILYTFGNLEKANDVSRVQRSYIMQMERTGYMTGTMKDAMILQLESLGMENISLAGTSFTPVGYGNTVYLHVECDVPFDSLIFGGASYAERQSGFRRFSDTVRGTALY